MKMSFERSGIPEINETTTIEELKCFSIENILSKGWVSEASRVIRLSYQMTKELLKKKSTLQEKIVQQEKVLVIVWNLLTMEAWRRNVLVILLNKENITSTTSLPVELTMHAELAYSGIAAMLLANESTVSSIDSLSLDLVDWSVRQLTDIASLALTKENGFFTQEDSVPIKYEEENLNADFLAQQEIKINSRKMLLSFGLRGVEILQQLSFNRNVLPLCVTSRLLRVHDCPQLISTLLQLKPWQKECENGLFFFQDGQWVNSRKTNSKISKMEMQLWLTLFSLLLQHRELGEYELTSSKKTVLMKLQSKLRSAIEYVPELEPLNHWLTSLSVMSLPPPKKIPFMITVPQIGEQPLLEWKDKLAALSSIYEKKCLNPSKEDLSFMAKYFSAAFDLDTLEQIMAEPPTCGSCGEEAAKRCSRCRIEWYCRRECQVKHWKRHKNICDIVSQGPKRDGIKN